MLVKPLSGITLFEKLQSNKTVNLKQQAMKSTAMKLLAIVVMAMMTIAVSAQDNGKQRKSREELAQIQAQRIADDLAFDDKTTAKFIDTYCRYQKDVWALGPRMGKGSHAAKGQQSSPEAKETVKQRLDRSQKLLDIRKKYYAEYSKFLTEKQIGRVYELEKQMMDRLAKHAGRPHHKR